MNDSIYNNRMNDLIPLLNEIQDVGEYCFVDSYSGSVDRPLGQVEIKKIIKLTYPIKEDQAKTLISCAVKAPYGKGTETLTDTSVRDVWQLDTKQIKVDSIDRFIGEEGLSNVAKSLGLEKEKIKANLYKLLVYEKGSFFLPHKDSEKEDKMFGTLVVSLPSYHKGGDLLIRHTDQEKTIKLDDNDQDNDTTVHYTAFYADCEHEVKPVTEGYRVCLVYNLCRTGKRAAEQVDVSSIVKSKSTLSSIESILHREFIQQKMSQLVFVLDHSYTPAAFQLLKLKGKDLVISKVLAKVCPTINAVPSLAIINITEEGYLFSDRAKQSEIPRDPLGEGKTDDPSYKYSLSSICPFGNNARFDGSINIQDGQVFPPNSLVGTKSDKRLITETTGNEGSTYEKFYHRAAILILKDSSKSDSTSTTSTSTTSTTNNSTIPPSNDDSTSAASTSTLDSTLQQTTTTEPTTIQQPNVEQKVEDSNNTTTTTTSTSETSISNTSINTTSS